MEKLPAGRNSGRMPKEEAINALTHGLGAVLSLAGLVILVVLASLRGDAWHIVSCSIYGVTLVLLFSSSTLYHSCRSERSKHICRIIDHASIYLLIAGTYTPFVLVTLRGGWGWSLFGVVWGLALAGIVFQIFFVDRFRLLQVSDLSADGLAGGHRRQAVAGPTAAAGAALAAGRRFELYGGRLILSLEETPFSPCRVAPFCPGRRHMPLFRDTFLRAALTVGARRAVPLPLVSFKVR